MMARVTKTRVSVEDPKEAEIISIALNAYISDYEAVDNQDWEKVKTLIRQFDAFVGPDFDS
jgi:hypothetical protein